MLCFVVINIVVIVQIQIIGHIQIEPTTTLYVQHSELTGTKLITLFHTHACTHSLARSIFLFAFRISIQNMTQIAAMNENAAKKITNKQIVLRW